MAHITKIGNSRFALVPAHAAKQLSLLHKSPIRVCVEETCIRISPANAKAPGAESSQAEKGQRPKLVGPVEEPW